MRELLQSLITLASDHQNSSSITGSYVMFKSCVDRLLQDIDFAEEFLKSHSSGLHSKEHFGESVAKSREAQAACHCHYNAFGVGDEKVSIPHPEGASPCGHVHSGSCAECNKIAKTPLWINNLFTLLMNIPAQDKV